MAFSEETKREIFNNASGRCQAKGCGVQLIYNHHDENQNGAWEAHHITPVSEGGKDTASNGKALCLKHHKETPSYGRH